MTDVDTPVGLARVHRIAPRGRPRASCVLGHGAGGGIDAPDLVAVAAALAGLGVEVLLAEQPYRVAGRRAPAPAAQLDAALAAVAAAVRRRGRPLLLGGRSLGARVACRVAARAGAAGVLALAFPLHPPGHPERSRLAELTAVAVPVLVVQGARDPFGAPAEFPPLVAPSRLREVPGDHALRADLDTVAGAVTAWVAGLLGDAQPVEA